MLYKVSKRTFSSIKNYFYTTTPIFYVNAAPHIGHLYSVVLSDAIARYEKLKNPDTYIKFSTGTDEHGTKIQHAATNHKISPQEYCDDISQKYKSTFKLANINYSDFIRTTESRHIESVQSFWNVLRSKNVIYSDQYCGWYCVSDETFLTDSQMKINSDGSRISIESGHPCEWTEESNYMFMLSKFQEDVVHWIKSGNKIKPEKFEKILLDYLTEPLPDLSISRPTSRVHWGITVPEDDSQTIYVWLDALVNYLTCIGYPAKNFENHWPPNVQVIGKDILKFHGIYWPAFLIAAGLDPPNQLFVHSHWTVDGQKMSKSKFNVVDPVERSQYYTMEGIRYFLLREGVAHSDGNYSDTKLHRILNSELADTLGNLLSRACAKSLNPKQIYPKIDEKAFKDLIRLNFTRNLVESVVFLPQKCFSNYESYNFYLVIDEIISALHVANNFFENCKPWELKKDFSHYNALKLETIIALTMDVLRISGILLQPIIPDMSEKLLNKLSVPFNSRSWKDTLHLSQNNKDNIPSCESYVTNREKKYPNIEKKLSELDAVLFKRILIKNKDNDKKDIIKNKIKKVNFSNKVVENS
ncbi:methionine--tRNA ligase, mitochondrial [Condylostylus longicornis]|uniref:methionine--tRNA ligase, mitochondrial n=1 Tax=Condylostylus longicornis TaxID=2530218 RepID=UPI00244E57B4|nr:methionine--tRNA ligase, mitochondrial [Condylostylus longicornis]